MNPAPLPVDPLPETAPTPPTSNPDAITGAPGSHPVGTGVGAASVGLTGAAVGTLIAGPVGGVVGAVVGAVAGGLGGKAAGEALVPTVDDAAWRETHAEQPYATLESGDYDAYASAYRNGHDGYEKFGATGKDFDAFEPELRTAYETSGATLPWENAREASRTAWRRAEKQYASRYSGTAR